MKSPLITILLSFIFIAINGQENSVEKGLKAINQKSIQGQLEFLASDWMQGRETGTEGIYLAGDYIASMFKVYGIKAGGVITEKSISRSERMAGIQPELDTTYFQNFSLLNYTSGNEQTLKVIDESGSAQSSYNFKYKTDFNLRTSSVGFEIDAPVVFVGYGYKNEQHDYNDFEDVDVKGKVILRLAGFPGHMDTSSTAYKNFKGEGRWSSWYMRRDKNDLAEKHGAVAVIEVDTENDGSIAWATNYPFRYNSSYNEGTERLRAGQYSRLSLPGDTLNNNLVTLSVTMRVANKIIEGTGVSFSDFEQQVVKDVEPISVELKNKTVQIITTVESEVVRARNVLGYIEGEINDEIILIGAHYDHEGMKDGYIWNGSDDNASGTVGMMTLAKAIAATGVKPKRTIAFAAWSGEESGLLGSKYYADNSPNISKTIFYLNYDMISRNDDDDSLGNKFSASFSSEYPILKELSEKYTEELNLNLDIKYRGSKRPRGGSDHASFSAKDIPILYYFAGFHEDYHQIGDHAEKANYQKMVNVTKLGYRLIWELANMESKLAPQKEEN